MTQHNSHLNWVASVLLESICICSQLRFENSIVSRNMFSNLPMNMKTTLMCQSGVQEEQRKASNKATTHFNSLLNQWKKVGFNENIQNHQGPSLKIIYLLLLFSLYSVFHFKLQPLSFGIYFSFQVENKVNLISLSAFKLQIKLHMSLHCKV